MALTVKTLYDGKLSGTARTVLYTVPAGKAAVVKTIRVGNRDTQARTLNLYYLRSGLTNNDTNVRMILPLAMSLAPGTVATDDGELSMGTGDQVVGDASAADKIDCVISGIERDA